MQQITIYCASSPAIPQKYFEAAAAATRIAVEAGYGVLYGGGATGLMGCVADTVLECGGYIKGIIPRFMIEVEWEHKGVKDMVHVNTMHARKELLIKDTSAVLALPGGNGTLEELYEVLSLKKLGQFPHPIVLLNTDGYYDPLVAMAERMAEENFMRREHLDLWRVIEKPEDLLQALADQQPWGPESIGFAAVKNGEAKE